MTSLLRSGVARYCCLCDSHQKECLNISKSIRCLDCLNKIKRCNICHMCYSPSTLYGCMWFGIKILKQFIVQQSCITFGLYLLTVTMLWSIGGMAKADDNVSVFSYVTFIVPCIVYPCWIGFMRKVYERAWLVSSSEEK